MSRYQKDLLLGWLIVAFAFMAGLLLGFTFVRHAHAREIVVGQYENSPFKGYFPKLMMPDTASGQAPTSCCGEADAYEADDFDTDPADGGLVAVLTCNDEKNCQNYCAELPAGQDYYPDGACRQYFAPGTRVKIPNTKVVTQPPNITGHGWVFMRSTTNNPYCYVPPAGF